MLGAHLFTLSNKYQRSKKCFFFFKSHYKCEESYKQGERINKILSELIKSQIERNKRNSFRFTIKGDKLFLSPNYLFSICTNEGKDLTQQNNQ